MKIGNKEIIIGIALSYLLLFLALFNLTGIVSIIVIAISFYMPIYFIVRSLDIEPEEKIFLPFFLGIGIVPTLVYWLGILISFRWSAIVVIILLTGIGVYLSRVKK